MRSWRPFLPLLVLAFSSLAGTATEEIIHYHGRKLHFQEPIAADGDSIEALPTRIKKAPKNVDQAIAQVVREMKAEDQASAAINKQVEAMPTAHHLPEEPRGSGRLMEDETYMRQHAHKDNERLGHLAGVLEESMKEAAKVDVSHEVKSDAMKKQEVQEMVKTSAVERPEEESDEKQSTPYVEKPELPFSELQPFGRENVGERLTDSSIDQSNAMVDQLERAEAAEEKRAVFRSLTRLRGVALSSFDGIARSHTGNIEEYAKTHQWRDNHPIKHLAEEESDVKAWAFPADADFF